MSEYQSRPPMPVHTLQTSSAELYTARPGVVAFLGVMGMIVAIFGAMFSGYTMLMVSAVTGAGTKPSTASSSIVWSPVTGSTRQNLQLITPAQRDIAVNALAARQPLTQERKALVGALLQEYTSQIIAVPKTGFSSSYVDGLIVEAGVTDDKSADYYVLSSGRIEVNDHAATFRGNGANGAEQVTQQDLNTHGSALSSEEIDRVMVSLKGSNLTPEQRAAIPKYLADPSQTLVSRKLISENGAALFATEGADESLILSSSTGQWTFMDRHGNVTTTPSGFATSPGAKVPRSARTMLNITSLLNLLLSMALFVICLGALHYGPRTRRRFMLYVPVKLIVVAVGTLAVHRFIAATTWETANVLATIYAIAGALFPVLAIFLLSGRQVRAYFSSVGG